MSVNLLLAFVSVFSAGIAVCPLLEDLFDGFGSGSCPKSLGTCYVYVPQDASERSGTSSDSVLYSHVPELDARDVPLSFPRLRIRDVRVSCFESVGESNERQ